MSLTVSFRKLPKPYVAALMILVGVGGRIFLASAANIEPVLILSMLAGAILGAYYTIVVPVAIMGLSDLYFYIVPYGGGQYSTFAILGLAAFVYSGFVFVAGMGGFAMRRRLLWRTRTIAIFTAISIPLTIAFDLWTAFGDWLFLMGPSGIPLLQVLEMQVIFTLIHILSSLLFAPILGTTFLAVHTFGVPFPADSRAEVPQR